MRNCGCAALALALPALPSNRSYPTGCSNRFTQKERFRMVMAYLKSHDYLTVKRYAKMTEMSKEAAKAELDAFAADKDRPIEAVIRGKKKVYILRK